MKTVKIRPTLLTDVECYGLELCNRLEPYFLALGLIDRKRFLRRAAIDRIVQPDSTFRNETMRRCLNMLILPRE